MEGFITERQEPDGRIRRKGEMKLPHRKSDQSFWVIIILLTYEDNSCKTHLTTIQTGDLPVANKSKEACLSHQLYSAAR